MTHAEHQPSSQYVHQQIKKFTELPDPLVEHIPFSSQRIAKDLPIAIHTIAALFPNSRMGFIITLSEQSPLPNSAMVYKYVLDLQLPSWVNQLLPDENVPEVSNMNKLFCNSLELPYIALTVGTGLLDIPFTRLSHIGGISPQSALQELQKHSSRPYTRLQ